MVLVQAGLVWSYKAGIENQNEENLSYLTWFQQHCTIVETVSPQLNLRCFIKFEGIKSLSVESTGWFLKIGFHKFNSLQIFNPKFIVGNREIKKTIMKSAGYLNHDVKILMNFKLIQQCWHKLKPVCRVCNL